MNSGEVVNTNIKYRLEFSKTDRMVFIGHLDLLKFFQRTFKRAGIPIGHSWGFNPHQLTTFAVPLALGVSSVGEILDIQLTEKMDCDVIKDTLNNNLPEGIDILQVVELEFSAENCAAAVDYADYCVTLDDKYDNINEVVNEVLSAEEINIERTVKKKNKIVNDQSFTTNIFPIRLVDDQYLADVVNDFVMAPSLRSPVATIHDNNIELYIDKPDANTKSTPAAYKFGGGLEVNEIRLSYIGKPGIVKFNEDIGGTDVDCELPESMHVDIVNHAVDLYRTSLNCGIVGAQGAQQQQQRENVRNNARDEGYEPNSR